MSKEEFLKKARDMNQDVEYEYKKRTKKTVIANGTDDGSSGDDHSLNNRNT